MPTIISGLSVVRQFGMRLTAHPTHDFIKDEECAVLIADRLHSLEVSLRRRNYACSRTNNGLCDDLVMVSSGAPDR